MTLHCTLWQFWSLIWIYMQLKYFMVFVLGLIENSYELMRIPGTFENKPFIYIHVHVYPVEKLNISPASFWLVGTALPIGSYGIHPSHDTKHSRRYELCHERTCGQLHSYIAIDLCFWFHICKMQVLSWCVSVLIILLSERWDCGGGGLDPHSGCCVVSFCKTNLLPPQKKNNKKKKKKKKKTGNQGSDGSVLTWLTIVNWDFFSIKKMKQNSLYRYTP